MIKKGYKAFIILAACLAIAGLAVFGYLEFSNVRQRGIKTTLQLPLINLTDNFYNQVNFSSALRQATGVNPEKGIKVVIVPHHLLASEIDAKILRQASGEDYGTIVIIGPNHGNTAAMKVFSALASWQTPEGNLNIDQRLTKKFISDFGIISRPEVFTNEHSIGAIVPWVKHFWPKADILPINLSVYADQSDSEKIADWLEANLPPNSLIIASMDFSHYLSFDKAQINDLKTEDLIMHGNSDLISRLDANDYVDSPATLAAIASYAKKEGLTPKIIEHNNSYNLMMQKPDSTTSYFGVVYRKNNVMITSDGLPQNHDSASKIKFLFFGDIMLDRYVGDKIKAAGSEDFIFSSLASSSIFQGNDIVSANLEGAVTDGGAHWPPVEANDFAFAPQLVAGLKKYNFNYFNIANNHLADQGENGIIQTEKNLNDLGYNFAGCADREVGDCTAKIVEVNGRKIGFTGASMVYGTPDEDVLTAKIRALATSTDLVIAQMHWGTEYQHEMNNNQIELAHKLIDAGADMVIGHHPHVVGGIEIYKNKPIFYSLGNFVFDQYFSTDTQDELGVKIETDANNFTIDLLPIKSKATHLRLMNDQEKNKFLNELAGWSVGDDSFKAEIKTGKIIINKN
jgi:poly-gamma-glutamate synthesis protein (capsule biosynthesis protein)